MCTENDFYLKTKATFKGCKRPKRDPDYVSRNKWGDISSEYWYTRKGVIRCSKHWSAIHMPDYNRSIKCGKVSTCFWVLKSASYTDCGSCRWDKFRCN